MAYSIEVIPLARQEVLGACIYYMEGFDRWEPFIFHTIVVRGGGKTIVINSGLVRDLSTLDPFWPSWPGERKIVMENEGRMPDALLSDRSGSCRSGLSGDRPVDLLFHGKHRSFYKS